MNSVSISNGAVALSAANSVLRQKGRSFYWARALLKAEHADRATRLYSLCRYIDDLADEATSIPEATAALEEVKRAILEGHSTHPVVQDGLRLIEACGIDAQVMCELVKGVGSDLCPVALNDQDELLRYCFQVAGTVGLMMCNVLGCHNPAALPHAVDLGIAMQLTNICRDVQADAIVGRRYLPASMVGDVPAAALVNPQAGLRPRIQACLIELLQLAEHYYRSGELGLAYLPTGARIGILTAARVYREIGVSLAQRDHRVWQGRAVVSPVRKLALTAKLLLGAPLQVAFWQPTQLHDPALHSSFAALLNRKGAAGCHTHEA